MVNYVRFLWITASPHPTTFAQGKYDVAEQLYERSQAIREKTLGPEHPDVAQSLKNRAGLLEEKGEQVRVEGLSGMFLVVICSNFNSVAKTPANAFDPNFLTAQHYRSCAPE